MNRTKEAELVEETVEGLIDLSDFDEAEQAGSTDAIQDEPAHAVPGVFMMLFGRFLFNPSLVLATAVTGLALFSLHCAAQTQPRTSSPDHPPKFPRRPAAVERVEAPAVSGDSLDFLAAGNQSFTSGRDISAGSILRTSEETVAAPAATARPQAAQVAQAVLRTVATSSASVSLEPGTPRFSGGHGMFGGVNRPFTAITR